MPPTDTKIKKLQDLLRIVDESITREEFLKSFEAVIQQVLKAEKKALERVDEKTFGVIDQLRADFKNLSSVSDADLSTFKASVTKSVDGLITEQQNALNFLRDKIRSLKNGNDGKDGKDGKNGLDGRPGKDGRDGEKGERGEAGKGGGGKGIGLYVGGAKKLLTAQTLNLVGGDNVTLAYSYANGLNTVTINGAGGGGSGITRSIVITSGSATMGATAAVDYVYLVAGAHTMTLPTAVSNTNRYTVKNNHSANITVDTTSSQTIDGTTTISLAPQESVDIISTNTNWNII